MKQLKDYLHLYLGCEVQMEGATLEKVIIGPTFKRRLTISFLQEYHSDLYRMKLILRPLSDMSIPEFKEYEKSKEWHKGYMLAEASGTIFLLSKHFDLFNLIPDGLAIDRTKLNTELSDERSVASKDSQRTNAD